MSSPTDDDKRFEQLAAAAEAGSMEIGAPARLKSRIYSALIRKQQAAGALAPLSETLESGRQLCVFEQLVQIAPVGQTVQSIFYCNVCHARVLAEHFENPPIWWRGCPYAEFKKG